MAVLSFLMLLCLALCSPSAGFRLENIKPVDPYISEIYPAEIPLCWRGWLEAEDRCYKLFRTPRTWHEAQAYCEKMSSNLASVHNYDDVVMIQSLYRTMKPGPAAVWIGGSDAVSEGKWQWSDDTPFDWDFWSPGQPDDLGEQDCMSFATGGQAFDENCSKKLPFVCAANLPMN